MSFSSNIKQEILDSFSSVDNKCCKMAEKFGECLTVVKHKKDLENEFFDFLDIASLKECCVKSILKGAFVSSGCIVNPQNDYHFEISFKNKACSEYIFNLLSLLEFTPRSIRRKSLSYIVYIKDSEQISLLISILGASKSLLEFENVRVEKNVKNNINRSINCETANFSKTISASLKQLEAIKKLEKSGKLLKLDAKLKETAMLRKDYPDGSLDFLVKKFNEHGNISKSGLKHRLDKLVQLAQTID